VAAAAAKGGGVGSARGRLVAHNAVAVTYRLPFIFPLALSSLWCARACLLCRADLFFLPTRELLLCVCRRRRMRRPQRRDPS
jgi:hypothetical protein